MTTDDRLDELDELHVRTVVLPLDGSPFSTAALPTAQALATRFGAELHTISVAAEDGEAERLRRLVADAIGEAIDPDRMHVVVADDPATAITRFADERPGSVITMSARGRGRVSGAIVGSTARAIVQTAASPLLVVGPQADRPTALVGRSRRRRPASWAEPLSEGDVVVAVDGSPGAELAVPVAARWAAALGSGLSIVTVAEDVPSSGGGGERRNRFGPPAPHDHVTALAERWRGAVPGGVEAHVVHDPISVASGLRAHIARHPVGLVVVATRARDGLERLRAGSAAADIVRTSTAPTLVVPVHAVEISPA